MLSKGRVRSRSEKGNLYGFIADWNVLILDTDGRTLKSNIPGDREGSDIAYGDLDNAGSKLDDFFDDSEISEFSGARSHQDKASALGRLFGACAMVPGGFVVGTSTNTVSRFAGEWTTRQSRLVPAKVPGTNVSLTPGTREILALIAFEGHPRMAYAIYCEGITADIWGQKFQFPDDYLYDGFVSTARSYARGDAPALREFVASYREDVENTYDCPIGRELIQRFG